MKERPTDYTARALKAVAAERQRQTAKWGAQDHTAARWLMILGEEYGEACRAGCDLTFPATPQNMTPTVDQLRTELTHVAAVAVAMIECIDRNRAFNDKAKHKRAPVARGEG